MKIDNPVIGEVRKVRGQILAAYNWDYRAMTRDMMKRQWESGRKVIPPTIKILQQDASPDRHSAARDGGN